jgi:N utilization substance protein B
MGSRRKARVLSMQALFSWDYTRQSGDELCGFPWLDEERRELLEEETLNFARLLVMGTLEHIEEIDEVLKKRLEHWDFTRLGKVDLAILRISIYALLFQKDIPASVTIDEAIDLAKHYGSEDSYRFVNGVLDGVRRQLSNTE